MFEWNHLIAPIASAILAVAGTTLTFKIKQVKIDEHMKNMDQKIGGLCKSVDIMRKEKASEAYADDLKERIMKLDEEKVDEKTFDIFRESNALQHDTLIAGQEKMNTAMMDGFKEVKALIEKGAQ